MVRLVLLLVYMNLPNGQSAENEVIYGIGIKLCNLRCTQRGSCMSFAYDIERLACHLSNRHKGSWTMGRFAIYPRDRDQMSAGACSDVNCKSNTRCVETRRGGAVCVEGNTVRSTLNSRCSTLTDCPAHRNFVCLTKTCKCAPGHSFNPSKNSCVRRHTVSSSLESRCSTDTDCPADRNFVCFTKTCKCVPGYSFNPSNNSCVRRCTKYGKTFTTYRGLDSTNNIQQVTKGRSKKDCLVKCIRFKFFICISYKYESWFHKCRFSHSGYLDVPPSQRVKGKRYSSNMRNCA